MTSARDRVLAALGEEGRRADTSLQAKSLARAIDGTPPKTLTPYEWQQWYKDHGVPASHRPEAPDRRRWWQFWRKTDAR